ncbi:hypothetical protein BV25DRAFT_847656 [Artomyces pyxidatus]|uniref:Uncharacterized protein n=1 Tax=Artomyces pyxidatus TaxID=48021 RepID=A0ACB8TGX3_9AGAM|nr:hypothetical protein BV25DRAFT_847656 [Artomyces pyxidatus]
MPGHRLFNPSDPYKSYQVPDDFGPPFHDDDADVILRSSELVDFRVHKRTLSQASPVFRSILTQLPNAITSVDPPIQSGGTKEDTCPLSGRNKPYTVWHPLFNLPHRCTRSRGCRYRFPDRTSALGCRIRRISGRGYRGLAGRATQLSYICLERCM